MTAFWQAFEWVAATGDRTRQRRAAEEIDSFISGHMAGVPVLEGRDSLLAFSLAAVDHSLDGHYCEFGVYRGASINHIASLTSHTVHGFDSFEGLPESWAGFDKGTFAVNGLPAVRDNVILHKGWFDESLPVWAQQYPGPIAFAHLDADLYSSTKTVFDILGDRLVAGSVLQFDEYYNFDGWQEGEFRAFREFMAERDITFEYLGYTSGPLGQQAAARILTVPGG